jgi:hypothetical protein
MKIFILTFGLLIVSIFAKSQIMNSISVYYGISRSDLNLNYSEPYFNSTNSSMKSITGFYSGINFESFGAKYLAMDTGIGFYQKGGLNGFIQEGDGGVHSLTWNLDYLTIDTKLKAKYRYKNISPYLLIGPRFDYLLKSSSEFRKYVVYSDVNKINYGIRYGIGIQYFIDKLFVGISWEDNVNFNSVVDNNGKKIRPAITIDDNTMILKCGIGFVLNE